jgi:hypothetical protein
MIQENTQPLADLTEQLSEALMAAAICADEIRAILRTELDSHTPVRWGRSQDTKLRVPPGQRRQLPPTGDVLGRAPLPAPIVLRNILYVR